MGDGYGMSNGTLWIVATPIGSLDDFAPRARGVLETVDLILAEDTRHSRRLLTHVGVVARGRLRSLHEHNEERKVSALVSAIEEGRSVALLSDAGTPVLSDPGFLLVREARRYGLPVRSVPGPSAYTTALAAAGQPPLPATLVGFLPYRRGARLRRIAELAAVPWTLVVLLSPHRLGAELEDLVRGLGEDRPATLLAELSKVHERGIVCSLGELLGSEEVTRPRGEYVLVVGPRSPAADAEVVTAEQAGVAFEQALAAGHDRREAMRAAARRLDVSRRELYSLLLENEKR